MSSRSVSVEKLTVVCVASRSWTFEQAIPVATLVAVALAAMQMGGVMTYAKHRNWLLAGAATFRSSLLTTESMNGSPSKIVVA